MSKRLAGVAETARTYNFTEASLRWHIFQAPTNGLKESGAIIRIGRSIRIDHDRFDAWLDSKATGRDGSA
jgi:hypothetical protein